MPARRSTRSSRAAVAILAAVIGAPIACERGPDRSPAPSLRASSSAAPVSSIRAVSLARDTPLSIRARRQVAAAVESARALRPKLGARAFDVGSAYFALRHDLASAAPLLRARGSMACEVLFGPPRSVKEAGGARLLLDGAIARGDLAEAARQVQQIERGLLLAEAELDRSGLALEPAANALSEAAYELGALLLEATPDLPADTEAILADTTGTIDGIVLGGQAIAEQLGVSDSNTSALRRIEERLIQQLHMASPPSPLHDRAGLALATGRLGAALRGIAAKGGVRTRLPYLARVPVAEQGALEPVSILTLPGPRRAAESAAERHALAAVGRQLFFDKRLSRGDVRACSSCHQPERGFADGIPRAASLDPAVPALRHTPTLLYTSLAAAQLWDGGTVSPASQALAVIHRRAEMGLDAAELAAKLGAIPAYRDALSDGAGQVSPARAAAALVAFESEALAPADAPIDRFARGDEGALSPEMRRGLDVFASRGRCARCHVPPSFGGSRPLDFAVPVFAVIGVPDAPTGHALALALDPDRGRALVTHQGADEHAFKTPTVRDVARTAPYFHHGRFARLEDVVRFYDEGGGRGLGLDVPNQDPDVRPLKLSAEEQRALLVFLREALLDATPPERLAKAR